MPRQTINLGDDNWHFGQVPRRGFTDANIYDLPAVTEWLPATVPGNVRTDLLALGRIPDPSFAEGYKESLWVEEMDWWYRRQIQLDPLTSERRAFLMFAGIDYLSAIFVDGQEMTRHEGMFSHQVVEVTGALRTGKAEVAVRLWGSSALPHRQLAWWQRLWQKMAGPLYGSWAGIYPDRSATLKCQMSFGWDFAPPIRTMGLWDEVSLLITGPVFIAEARVGGQVDSRQPLAVSRQSFAPANLSLDLTLDADRPCRVEVRVQVKPANFQGTGFGPFRFPLDLPAGRRSHRLEFHLPEAALWQPWDRGQPHLYHLQITLVEAGGELLDETVIRTGIRTVDRQNWRFSLNGREEFIRGLNWVPADSFPGRLRADQYTRLLNLARQSGANLLRVWGGGLREKRVFYDRCDELGLLVWQEFPFACMFLGTYPRQPAYLARVEAECGAIVRQLRHHPCVVVWGGGNEFSQRRNRPLLDTLATVVSQQDGSRPFLPVSPSFDQGRDTHNWHVWHGQAPIQTYQAETAAFLSEFGLQALPHPDTLQAALPDPTTAWQTHHADPPKLDRYAALFNLQNTPHAARNTYTPTPHSPLPTPQSQISSSQRAQAVALQTAIEHMRRRKGQAGGLCLWQFNEPWPAISWAIVDYFGRPKLAYERLAAWYNLLLISLKFPVGRRWQAGETFRAEIWAINDGLAAFKGCELQIKIGQALVHTQRLDLPADSVQPVGMLAHHLTTPPHQITLTLQYEGEIVAWNYYDLAWSDTSGRRFYHHLRRWLADWVLL